MTDISPPRGGTPRRAGRYTVDLTATGLAVQPLLTGPPATGGSPAGAQWPIEARVDARLSGQGTLDMPQLGGTLQLSDVAWGDYRIGTVHAGLTIDGDEVRVRSDLPEARATIEAALGLSARTFTIDAALTNADLGGLVRPHGPAGSSQAPAGDAGKPEVQGTVTLSANLAGGLDNLAASTAAIDVGATDVVVQGLDVHMDRPAHLRYADGQLAAEDFELRAGSSTLSARGRLGAGVSPDDALRLDLTGSVADFLPLLRLAPNARGVEASGTVGVHLRATGPLDAPDLTADVSLAAGSFASDAVPAISAITLTAAYHAGVFEVTEAHGTWQGAEATASGRLPIAMLGPIVPAAYLRSLPAVPGPAHADVRLTSVTSRALEPFLDQDTVSRLGGRIDVRATVDAEALDAKSVRADIVFDRADLELARVSIGQVAPTHLRLADGRLDVVHWSWAGAGNHLDVTGNVDLTGSAPKLALGVSGSLDLRMIGAVAPDVATVGRAVLDMKATGTLEDPTIEGHVSVDQTDIVIRNPRLAITDLQGTATFTRDHVRLDDVTANANGGTVEVAGAVDYRDFALTGGAITIRGRGLALAVADNLRTEIDADLTLSADANAPALTGRVTVVRGYYREPISLTEQLLTGSNTSSPALEGVEPGPFDRVRLNIAVVSAEDLVVDNNYAKAEVGSNLRVAGTIGAPVLAGRLTVQEGGEVFLGGRTYTIQRGTVDFLDPTRIEPTIDLALETRVQQYDITLEVSGTPETLDVSLRSPGQSQEDVVSLLLTGQLAAQSTVAQTEIARGQLLMLLSGEFLGFAGRAVGLDSVQVGRGLGGAASDFDLLSTDTDPSARLTIARHLSRNVELVFSQSLRESGGSTWIVSYRPGRNVELRATTEDNNSRSYEFRHELVFGGPRRAGAEPARTSGGENVRVSAVTFSGSPGATSDELRSRVRLKAGDRFDFYRWQQDRDRLTAWYHDRDYLEARVTARRTESPGPAAGVVLEYVIERGPRTVLTVTGVTLPGDVIARMKEAWGRAVFDGFLRDDLEQMAREALARDGYLRAEVTTTVQEPESGVKAIVLQVTPGQSFDRRELVFTGNARIPSDELRAVVEQQGLSVEAWLNPDTLQSALERYYRSRGYMAAVVTPGQPVFDAGTATLPVVIDEGPLFHIGRVLVQGATAWSDDRVRSTSGLVPGSAYQPAAVEPARRAVERAYLREGYNDVRVSATARVDRDQARVDVEFDLTEGPQQVLAGVDVTGATVTTPGTIATAVDLAPGGPATLDKVYRAQKRLYDTGVFQSADVTLEPATAAQPVSGVQPVRAVVTLRELPRYRFRYGFRLTDDVAPVEPTRQVRPALVADLLRRNLFGRAISTGVAGQIESNRRLARAVMSLPTLFGLPLVTNVFATTSRDYFAPQSEYESGRVERRNEFTLEQRFRPAATMLVSYGYSFGNKHTFDPKPDPTSPLPSLDLATNIARLTATYAWDTRDDPSNAHRGWFHSSGMEFGSAALGSELRFIRYLAQQDYFRQVGGRVVLASAFRLGAGHAFGGQTLTEKFYAGGGTSVRGFAEDALGKSDFFGAVGGNALVVLSQEVRFPIFRWVRGVGFIDAGNVFPKASDLSFLDLEAGTGAGLRVHSPFGVLRLDFGIPLTHREQQPRGRWYVGIGQTF